MQVHHLRLAAIEPDLLEDGHQRLAEPVERRFRCSDIEHHQLVFGPNVSASIAFEEEGGEIRFGRTQVKAVVPSVRPLKVGATYLLALSIDFENRQLIVGPDTAYQLVNGRFEKLAQRGEPATRDVDQIEADLSEHVLSELRDLAAARTK